MRCANCKAEIKKGQSAEFEGKVLYFCPGFRCLMEYIGKLLDKLK